MSVIRPKIKAHSVVRIHLGIVMLTNLKHKSYHAITSTYQASLEEPTPPLSWKARQLPSQ